MPTDTTEDSKAASSDLEGVESNSDDQSPAEDEVHSSRTAITSTEAASKQREENLMRRSVCLI